MIDMLFAPLVVAIIAGVVVVLFEHWLKIKTISSCSNDI
ncbi:hypothetical protein RV15_GL000801 [Enterococcus silesiacus]|uniref:Type I toxin-antitoxin system Fst family toxin n=1 Tax=Enterococcus silesiacus TaxID=332949 RepID=A0AA91GK27_9ENTE|nr:hypothetical protein RV15_GL000801 [Enterococcus silesiacus]